MPRKKRKEYAGNQLTCDKAPKKKISTTVQATHTGTSQRIHFGTKRPVGKRAKTMKRRIWFRKTSPAAGYWKTGTLPSAVMLVVAPCVTACKERSKTIQESDLCQKINQPAENQISVERSVTTTRYQA